MNVKFETGRSELREGVANRTFVGKEGGHSEVTPNTRRI